MDFGANELTLMTGLKTWIFKWKKNGFRNAQGEAVKNAGIIRCISVQLAIRAHYRQKIRLQYVKGHSGDVGNDGADAMANRGTLLPAVKERDWEALELKLSEQLEQSSVETSDVAPTPTEVQDIDDIVENTVVDIPSLKMRKTSSDPHERKSHTAVAAAPLYSTATEASPWISSRSTSKLLPVLSAPQDEKMEVAAESPVQFSDIPASTGPQSMPLESPTTIGQTNFEPIRDKKISLKVVYALPPFVPVKYEEVNFEVGELVLVFAD